VYGLPPIVYDLTKWLLNLLDEAEDYLADIFYLNSFDISEIEYPYVPIPFIILDMLSGYG